MSERASVAVVGSGPGGAVAACVLAEAGRDVILVEEGPGLGQQSCRPFSIEEMTQKYRHGGVTAALGPCPVAYVEGCAVGGGSEVNSALYHRAPAARLEEWARRFAVEGLGEKDLAPHFEALEAELSVLRDSTEVHPAGRKLAAGAASLGLECRQAPRMARPGPGPLHRLAMSDTYIPRALKAGCRLLDQTRVERLQRRGRGWVLKARTLGPLFEIEADQVFLACGAIQTPALLRRSGLAPRAGATLAIHPMAKLVAQFPEEVNGPDLGVAAQQVKPPHGRWSFGCSISSPQNLALNLLDYPEPLSRLARDWRRMASFYVMVPGSGRGEVGLLPGCPDPLVRYALSPEELRGLDDGLQELARLLQAAGAERVFAAPAAGPDARLTTLHLMASCPMGEHGGLCAADSFGRVRGSEGLRLADASLFCGPLGVNPQGTVMALSRRNALAFLKGGPEE
ncbi:MAG: GMC family oxidoreductase [Elusimicrobia bacterium]|nr:GMC family oxidoreductase [Elusimicrobiota bacterium]